MAVVRKGHRVPAFSAPPVVPIFFVVTPRDAVLDCCFRACARSSVG